MWIVGPERFEQVRKNIKDLVKLLPQTSILFILFHASVILAMVIQL